MVIKLVKFGKMLISRPAGREAYLWTKAYLFSKKPASIEIDFEGVKVLAPSWIDEFINLLKKDYPGVKIIFQKSNNPTVTSSLEIIETS